jgi:hypothetical protein
MNRREKILLGSFLAVIAFWLGKPIFDAQFTIPLSKRIRDLKEVQSRVGTAEEGEIQVLVAGKRLKDWRDRSFPPDVLTAQSQYCEWITDLARLSGFQPDETLVVNPGAKPSSKGALTPIDITLKGEANLQAISRFLYHFHRTDLLQRITNVDVMSPTAEGNPNHGVTIKLQGLAVAGAPKRSRLFSRTTLQTATQSDDTQIAVTSNSGFPKLPGFQIRIGEEFLTVTEIDQNQWTVQRGQQATQADDYDADVDVELAPRRTIQARLNKAVKSDETTIQVADHVAFPIIGGFQVRLGEEILSVSSIQGTQWSVRRGVEDSQAVSHKRNSIILLETQLPEYVQAATPDNPFVKPPRPKQYKPKLEIKDQLVIRGTPLKAQAKFSNLNPKLGSPQYQLDQAAPQGLTIDEKTGLLTWEPTDDVVSEEYAFTVSASQTEAPEVLFSEKITVTLRDPNEAPILEVVDAQEIYLGQTVAFAAKATDADQHKLTFSLEKGSPNGASIEEDTGQFTWAPTLQTNPGEYKATVVVTDNGSPQTSSKKTVTIKVVEDASQFTFLIASIVQDDQREAWLYNRADNQRMVLFEGDRFAVGSIEAKVVSIDNTALVFRRNDDTIRIELGQSMQAGQPVKASPKTAATGEATTNSDGDPPAQN